MEREFINFLGLLAQNIINVTDTAFLGRVGEDKFGASAIGRFFVSVSSLLLSVLHVGSQILIARRNQQRAE